MNSSNAAQYIHLVALLAAGGSVQANRGTVEDPRWEDIGPEVAFSCEPHLYRGKLLAFAVDQATTYAATTALEAANRHYAEDGEYCSEGYPRELTDAELDAPCLDYDEHGYPKQATTSIRRMLAETREPGPLASGVW